MRGTDLMKEKESDESFFTCGLTSRMQIFPVSITSWMEFILVPYRLPSYSPCSKKRAFLMSHSISLRVMKEYIWPSRSSTFGFLEVTEGEKGETNVLVQILNNRVRKKWRLQRQTGVTDLYSERWKECKEWVHHKWNINKFLKWKMAVA